MASQKRIKEPVDGATAAAHVAYFMSDAAFIFPITPSSIMSEQAHEWSMAGRKNAFGQQTLVKQMQSEGGSAGALHGSLSTGALSTTFTSSQGLLLMIPNMYKIAGELIPCVIHIAARTIATEALSIFGDHTDVYAARSTGFAFLCASTVQECAHMAAAAHAATLASDVPFGHFFDGFRTSHEVQKIDFPSDEDLLACMNQEDIIRFRNRGLSCERPVMRGTAQNPDVFMQASEANLPYLAKALPASVAALERVNKVFGTNYKIVEYFGHPAAEDVIVAMGSGAEVAASTANYLNSTRGTKLGVVKIRLFRPFPHEALVAALPSSVKRICVLDRGRDAQAAVDPLHGDVVAALSLHGRTSQFEVIVGGVFGLSSKDFNPDQVLAVYSNLRAALPKTRFSIGIDDDVTHNSLPVKEHIDVLPAGTRQCLLWGIGGDGTVGANKTAIKLIADHTELHAQGYFAYDANKAGGLTVSHLRFGPVRFEAPFIVCDSDYVACHNFSYVHRFNLLSSLRTKGTFVLNCPCRTVEELDVALPVKLRRAIAEKQADFWVIDATKIAKEAGMGPFINMVLQSVFFYLSHVLDVEEALGLLKKSIKKMYARKGEEVVRKNVSAVDVSLDKSSLIHISYPADAWLALKEEGVTKRKGLLKVPERLKNFNSEVFEPVLGFEGESIPVSKMPKGGELPTGTSQLAKRGIAENVPHWDHNKCVQCNQCSFVCPHAVIRSYQISDEEMKKAPADMATIKSRKPGHQFRINVSALDCTGCGVCVEQCPVKCLEMVPIGPEYEKNAEAIRFVRDEVRQKPELGDRKTPVGIASYPPLLEYPGACGGCGETPLVRLLTQMFGERMVIAAATGCNSIWGGSFPVVPYTTNDRGEGPAWHNSLFEDGAELGYGMISGYRQRRQGVIEKVQRLLDEKSEIKSLTAELRTLLEEWVHNVRDFEKTRELRDKIKPVLKALPADADARLLELAQQHNLEMLARTSFWIIGGDGWAYDIDFGGLDHVIANNEDINILVLDTEVYSNTGGQRSKATPLGARAKFSVLGKDTAKKDLGRIAMTYETAYVASIAQGADQMQCMTALREAEAHVGPSIVIAYTPCMEHQLVRGMKDSQKVQKLAVETGYWILYRFNPDLPAQGKNPFILDSKPPNKNPKEFLDTQGRFVSLIRESPVEAAHLHEALAVSLKTRYLRYTRMASFFDPSEGASQVVATAPTTAPAASPAKGSAKRLQFLYASESGNSESAAKHAHAAAKARGLQAEISALDDYDFAKSLASEALVALFCSSCGDGIPSNGQRFWAWLQEQKSPALSGTSFALFGLGDTKFEEYLRIPKQVRALLLAAGANEWLAMGDGDENAGGFQKGLAKWEPLMLDAAASALSSGVVPVIAGASGTAPPAATIVAKPAPQPAVVATAAPKAVPPPTPNSAPPKPLDCAALQVRAEQLASAGKAIKVAKDVYWVGALDWGVRDFHGIELSKGSSYNCYLILGPTPTLVDTVKHTFAQAMLASIKALLGGDMSLLRYVVCNHAEPDHASALPDLLEACPNAEVVCTPRCRENLIKNFHNVALKDDATWQLEAIQQFGGGAESWKYRLVRTGDKLELGPGQTLTFLETPMVHWPESTFTYHIEEGVLFSMDAFGQHLASRARFDEDLDAAGTAALYEAAKSYYANILMLFGKSILNTLGKLTALLESLPKPTSGTGPVPRVLATAHGIAWRKDTQTIVNLYKRWANHVTSANVMILYDTMYGSTERMARAIMQGVVDYSEPGTGKRADCRLLLARDASVTESADLAIDAACIALGSSCLNNELLPTVARHVAYLKGLHPEGRSGVGFCSYGWNSGSATGTHKALESIGVAVEEPLLSMFSPDEVVLQKCREVGAKLAAIAVAKGVPYP